MNGFVDNSNRALMSVSVSASDSNQPVEVEVWTDTAIDGHFVMSTNLIKELGLDTLAETEAVLADGPQVILQSYVCYMEWFGQTIAAQVIENDGKYPLLGTALLDNRRLSIDYAAKSVKLI